MSGGVDSSVAAYLLLEKGYEVMGVTLRLREDGGAGDVTGAIGDASKVCGILGIPHHVISCPELFREKVIDRFIDEYVHGHTPNPCVVCNRQVKWASVLSWAFEHDIPYMATGHYSGIVRLENGRYSVSRTKNGEKDQTYALYGLTQEQLAHTVMPLDGLDKKEVRRIAEKTGLPVFAKPDSQEICFVPDNDYAGFIERETGGKVPPEGNFVTEDGEVLGRHKGITHYTVGQRRGLGLAMGHHVFVTGIRPDTNEVVIGEDKDVYSLELDCRGLNFMSVDGDAFKNGESLRLFGRIRYRHPGEWCTIKRTGEDTLHAVFERPVRAVTPGQAAVFYDGDLVACGGTIE